MRPFFDKKIKTYIIDLCLHSVYYIMKIHNHVVRWCLSGVACMLMFTPLFSSTFAASTVDTTFPTWAKPNVAQDKKDLSYRVDMVLPFSQDRNSDAYIVYPTYGVVVPVNTPSADDSILMSQGQKFDYYPYFERGALHYFGVSPFEWPGNMVIAAHSSFFTSQEWRYKTVFQVVPLSHVWDNIWYYHKNVWWTYDLYEYTIVSSFETEKSNVWIMQYDNDGKSYLTTYSCFPIGSNARRWVNKAVLSTTILSQSSLSSQPVAIATPEILLPAASVYWTASLVSLQAVSTQSTSQIQHIEGTTAITLTLPAKKAVVAIKAQKKKPSMTPFAKQQQRIDTYVSSVIAQQSGSLVERIEQLKTLVSTLWTKNDTSVKLTMYEKKMKRSIMKYIKQYTMLAKKTGAVS